MKKILVLLILGLMTFQANSQVIYLMEAKEDVVEVDGSIIKDSIYYYEGLIRINKQATVLTLVIPSGERAKFMIDRPHYDEEADIFTGSLMDFEGATYSIMVSGKSKIILIRTLKEEYLLTYIFYYK